MDGANYAAIGASLLVMLWLAAAASGLIAFALTRPLRRAARGGFCQSEEAPPASAGLRGQRGRPVTGGVPGKR